MSYVPDLSVAPPAGATPPAPGRVGRRRIGPGGIWGFILRRVLLGILTLALVSLIVFGATQLLPSDAARAILGKDATPESLATLRAQLGLDHSAFQQYTDWLGGLLHGDLGQSLQAGVNGTPISEVIGDPVRNSAILVLISSLLSIPLGIAIGSYGALRRDRAFDQSSGVLMLLLAAIPEFVVGIALVVLFATTVWKVLPAVSLVPPGTSPLDQPEILVLPVLTLVITVTPYVARIMRASMIEVLESDYIEMARLKGMNERTVLLRHALPNAIGPTLQVMALNLAYLAGGIIVVESVFAYPGIGIELRNAVLNRDMPTVQALAMIIATVYVTANLLADVATVLVTPRLRTRL